MLSTRNFKKMAFIVFACAIATCLTTSPAMAKTGDELQAAQATPTVTGAQIQAQSTKSKPYSAYLKKIRQYQKKYGKASVRDGANGSTFVSGLAYAELLDFGYKVKYLVVSYYDASEDEYADAPGSGLKCYPIEVWAYTGGKLKRVFRGVSQLAGQNVYCTAVILYKTSGKYYIPQGGGSNYPNCTSYLHCYGKKANGAFGRAVKLTQSNTYRNGSFAYKFYYNGKRITAEKYYSLVKKWQGKVKRYYPNTTQTANRNVKATITVTKKTIKELKRVAG